MWPNLQFPGDLVTFTEEILNEKFHFLCSAKGILYANFKKFLLWDSFSFTESDL